MNLDGRISPPVRGFFGGYHFLSNFHWAPVEYEGLQYSSSEAAFQAAKTLDLNKRKGFVSITPGESKRLGRQLELRPDWNEVKIEVMRQVLRAKFDQNQLLKEALLKTGDAYLEETNTWNDTFWGVCDGKGDNILGKLLMNLRDEYKTQHGTGKNPSILR